MSKCMLKEHNVFIVVIKGPLKRSWVVYSVTLASTVLIWKLKMCFLTFKCEFGRKSVTPLSLCLSKCDHGKMKVLEKINFRSKWHQSERLKWIWDESDPNYKNYENLKVERSKLDHRNIKVLEKVNFISKWWSKWTKSDKFENTKYLKVERSKLILDQSEVKVPK